MNLYLMKLVFSFQNLRKEQIALSNEVKSITADSFPGSEVYTALQTLGKGFLSYVSFLIIAFSVKCLIFCYYCVVDLRGGT